MGKGLACQTFILYPKVLQYRATVAMSLIDLTVLKEKQEEQPQKNPYGYLVHMWDLGSTITLWPKTQKNI